MEPGAHDLIFLCLSIIAIKIIPHISLALSVSGTVQSTHPPHNFPEQLNDLMNLKLLGRIVIARSQLIHSELK